MKTQSRPEPMAISERIQRIAETIADEVRNSPGNPSPTAQNLHQLATKAILGGIEDWVNYMKLFADPNNPAELARLIPTDGTTDEARQTARAYLAANGMCTEQTTENLQMRVTNNLDL
ncbi:MAG TPA: hypothetical protein VKD91_09495 [Pyrinomonadaceae bacterium]|nr:hypothetical protein [Pyrinomonadaceae bacterium]